MGSRELGPADQLRRLTRLVRSSPPLTTRIGYPHVPKCAGTSVTQEIRPHLDSRLAVGRSPAVLIDAEASRATTKRFGGPDGPDAHATLRLRHQLAYYHLLQPGTKFLYGHFSFGPALAEAAPDVAWITILRDPVDRVLSQYFYNRFKDHGTTRLDIDLDEFLEVRGPRALDDHLRYFCGPDLWDASQDQQVTAAIANLEQFDVIGTMDDLDGFRARFASRFGVTLTPTHVNASPAPTRDAAQVARAREVLERHAGPAREVHDHVLARRA